MCILQGRRILGQLSHPAERERQIDKNVGKRTKEKGQKRARQTEGQMATANPRSLLSSLCLSDAQRMKGLDKKNRHNIFLLILFFSILCY